MIRKFRSCRTCRLRRGAVLPLVAAGMVFTIGMLAFSIDIGYISVVKGQMQSAADAAALASASQLFDRDLLSGGTTQDLTDADALANQFATANHAGGVSLGLGAGDVVYGYIERPSDPMCPFDTTRTPYNSAQVKVQRTTTRNGEVGLFFAKIFNQSRLPLETTATATYEGNIGGFAFNDNYANQKCLLLPFSLDERVWDAAIAGSLDPFTGEVATDTWAYDPITTAINPGSSDGVREVKLYPTRNMTPGNFGTVDIGSANNSTSDIARQILYGPSKEDLALHGGSLELDSTGTVFLNGDTGISAGFKDELESIKGQPRIIPLHRSVQGNGNNAEFEIRRFVGCVILDVKLTGTNKAIIIQPEFAVDSTAKGGGPLSDHSFAYKPLQLTR